MLQTNAIKLLGNSGERWHTAEKGGEFGRTGGSDKWGAITYDSFKSLEKK